jgi:8-oxo-dGTP diphosphatase
MENLNFRIAVKAFITNGNAVLLLRRRKDDVHKPDAWDIPGGRLEPGENPFDGLRRETREEGGMDIDIRMPLDVHHFTRDDGQKITMIIFWCIPRSNEVLLSNEHQEYVWQSVSAPKKFPDWLHQSIQNFLKIDPKERDQR